MIALKRVSLKNFRSFLDKQEISFENGFYCLKGASGSGKTTILLAIAYTLGLNKIPGTQLQSIFTEDGLQTELDLDIDGNLITLARGEETYFIENGVKTEGATPLNVKIRQIFKNLESVDLLSFRNQRVDGRFLSLDDSEKKSFLSTVLGLSALEDFIDFQKESLDTVNLNLTTLKNKVLNVSETVSNVKVEDIAELEKTILDLRSKIKNIQEKQESLGYLSHNSSIEFDSIKHEKILRERRVGERNQEKVYEIMKLESKIKELVAEKDRTQKEFNLYQLDLSRKRQELVQLEKALLENSINIEKTREKKCYTCNQIWEDSEKEIYKLQSTNVDLQKKIANIDLFICAYTEKPFVEKVAALDEEIARLKLQRSGIELEKANTVDLDELEQAVLKQSNDIRAQLRELNLLCIQAEKEESFISGKIKASEQNKQLKVSLLEKKKELDLEINKVQKEVFFLETSIEANKEFLSKIFDEILLEISEDINKNISMIPNVKDVSFSFSSSVVSKNGNVKNRIETNIQKNGKKLTLNCLSGGQKSSIELLVDASVYSVISRRTGLDLNWLILDEPFEGLHPNDKEACLEILRKLHGNKTVLVVDHSTETKENFDKFIEVSTDLNGVSVVKYE